MNENKLPPEEHFKFIFRAHVEYGDYRYVRTQNDYILAPTWYQDPTKPIDYEVYHEREVTIKLSERDYQNFIKSYTKYLDLIEGLEDPIARDMFEKTLNYIYLKK